MMTDDKFVRVPHWLMGYLARADLNMTQFRIIHVVIRNTFGYHRTWNQFSLTFLSEQTGCNKRQVTRELGKMIEANVLIERYEDGKRLLMINPKIRNLGMDSSPPGVVSSDSIDTIDSDSLDTTTSDSLVTHIKKEVKKENKEKHYIDFEQIDDPYFIIYLNHFKRIMKRQHMRITEAQYQMILDQMEEIQSYGITLEEWESEVKDHFENLPKSNNGNIIAFLYSAPRRFDVSV